jgi:periplasmic divalent cation tolerance protein
LARKLTLADAADGQAVAKITCPSVEVADLLANALIERRVAACVTIVPGVTSVYRWQGEICRDSEVLLLVKTTLDRSGELLQAVEEIHPYDVPEVLWSKVHRGSQSYLDWLTECVKS